MSSILSFATKELIHRIIESGTEPIKAEGLMLRIFKIDGDSVTIGFDVVDRDGKAIVELRPTLSMSEGSTVRVMDLAAVFNITVSSG